MESGICLNCENSFDSGSIYCKQCGQKTAVHRLSWHDAWHDILHYITHTDSGIFYLIKILASKTGIVAKEFVAGKRKKYLSPYTFFLIAAAIYVLCLSFSPDFKTEQGLKKGMEMYNMRSQKLNEFFKHYAKFVSIFSVPVIAFIYWQFYKKRKFNFMEHFAGVLYMNGFTLLIVAPIILIIDLLAPRIHSFTGIGILLFQLIYFTIFYRNFMLVNGKGGYGKAFLITLFSLAIWSILTIGLSFIYMANGFWGLLS